LHEPDGPDTGEDKVKQNEADDSVSRRCLSNNTVIENQDVQNNMNRLCSMSSLSLGSGSQSQNTNTIEQTATTLQDQHSPPIISESKLIVGSTRTLAASNRKRTQNVAASKYLTNKPKTNSLK